MYCSADIAMATEELDYSGFEWNSKDWDGNVGQLTQFDETNERSEVPRLPASLGRGVS